MVYSLIDCSSWVGVLVMKQECCLFMQTSKAYFTKKELKVNPWADLKMGFDTINLRCYLSPSFGFTVPLANDYAFSVALASGVDLFYTVNVGMRVGFYF